MEAKQVDLVEANTVEVPVITNHRETKLSRSSEDYLDEYDSYYFENEKYFNVGHGGKQRNKREVELNSSRIDPSGNTRLIVNRMQNFEHNRRKLTTSS